MILAVLSSTVPPAHASANTRQYPLDDAIDSLLSAGALDSLSRWIPRLIDSAIADNDTFALTRAVLGRGRLELQQGRPADADVSLVYAIDLAIGAADTVSWMDAMGFRGFTRYALGYPGESRHCAEERLRLAQLIGHKTSEGWARTSLAFLTMAAGELVAARVEYEKAADLFRDENRPELELSPRIGLGRVMTQLGDIDGALDNFATARNIARQLGDKTQEAHAVNNLGTIEFLHGDMGLAARYFQQAYLLHRETGDVYEEITPAANVALARTYLGQYTEAADILAEVLETCEQNNLKDKIPMVLNELGLVRLMQGRPHTAVDLYERALASGDVSTFEVRLETTENLSDAYCRLGRTGDAIAALAAELEGPTALPPQWRTRLSYRMAVALRQAGRVHNAVSHAIVAAQSEAEAGEDVRTASMFLLSRCYHDLGNHEAAYDWFQRGVVSMDTRRGVIDDYEWREVYGRELSRNMVECGAILLSYPRSRTQHDRTEAFFNFLETIKARTLVERITEPRRRPGREAAPFKLLTLSEVRSGLAEGELLIEFAEGSDHVFVIAVTSEAARVDSLSLSQVDRARMELYCEVLSNPESGDVSAMSGAIGDILLAPVADLVSEASHLWIVPDGLISTIPFAALRLRDEGIMLDQTTIGYTPSASLLLFLRSHERRPGSTGVLAVTPGDPGRLAGVRNEISQLEQRFAGVTVLSDRTTLDRLSADPGFEVVHVAAHVEADDEKPWQSGILVGASGPASTLEGGSAVRSAQAAFSMDDPFWRARDIAHLGLNATLTVLSGCESARGRASAGEGVQGLTSAFLSAGVRSVVATLWRVDDAVTADLMERFYTYLVAGETVAEALRQAQRDIRSGAATGHPFYWAGFVVVGEGATPINLRLAGRQYNLLLYILLAAATLLAGGAIVRNRSHRQKTTRRL